MPDKLPNTDYNVKPTLKTSQRTDAGVKFDKNLTSTLGRNDVDLTEADEIINEIDKDLENTQGSFKKKIWDLSKMESLVHSDPKLESIYQDMEHEAEQNQRYGYHWNEAVLNIMFNDYVLNSPKYLQKYKMAIPSEKKRRDKSGIKDLQRKGEKQMQKGGVDTKDLTVNKTPDNVPEGNDIGSDTHRNSLSGVMEEQYKLMENWGNLNENYEGDMSFDPPVQPVDQSNQTDYLTHRKEKRYDSMNEHHLNSREEKEAFIYKNKPSLVMGQVKNMSDDQIDSTYNQIEKELGMTDNPAPKPEEKPVGSEAGIGGPVDESINENGDMIAAKQEDEEEINETTATISQGGGSGSGAFETKAGLDADFGKKKRKTKGIHTSFWDGGEMVESNYLTEPLLMESIYNKLNEDAIGPEDDSVVPLSEEDAVSKDQQQAAGAAYAVKKGDADADDLKGASKKMYDSMSKDQLEDKASTKHKGLPEKVKTDEGLAGKAIGGAIGAGVGMRTGMGAGTGASIGASAGDAIQNKVWGEGMDDFMGGNDRDNNLNIILQKLNQTGGHLTPENLAHLSDDEIAGMAASFSIEESIVNPENSQTMIQTMKDVPAGGGDMGGSFDGGMFEGKEIEENVATRTKCKNDEEPAKGVPINQSGGCKKKSSLKVSPEDRQKNPHNIKSRQERLKKQEKEMEQRKKEQSSVLDKSKKELKEQKELFESILGEDKKHGSMVNVDRLGKENEKNFVKDKKDSSLSDVIDKQDDFTATEQSIDVGENPYDLGEKIEAQKLKDNEMNSFENEGDSTNRDNKHIPKRNITSKEEEQVKLMRNGMHSWMYDNETNEAFEERMKRDMGEEWYGLRQEQFKFKAGAPQYSKDTVDIQDANIEKDQLDKYKTGFISQVESVTLTGKFRDDFGKNSYKEFKLNEATRIEKIDESFAPLSLDGLGNRYTTKVELNENLERLLKTANFYIKENKVYAFVEKKTINESTKIENKVVNEGLEKMKKMWNYKPSEYTDTKNTRNLIK